MTTKARVERYYSDNLIIYQHAEHKIVSHITSLINDHEKSDGIRVKFPIESRVKTIKSIFKKIQTRKFNSYNDVRDIVGIRIVVNNLCDVYDTVALLERNLLAGYDHEIEDMIKKPRSNGYRAIHINLTYGLQARGTEHQVPVEIQIKTLPQDLWSTLTHSDIYKQKHEIPAIIRSFTRTLGTLLNVVDEQALEIRSFMEQKITINKELSMNPDDHIDKEMIARIIQNELNYEINEEEYMEIITSLDAGGIRTIDLIRKLLKNEDAKKLIDAIFFDALRRKATPLEYMKYGSLILFDALKGGPIDPAMAAGAIFRDYDITNERCLICRKCLEGYEADFSRKHYESKDTLCPQCLENNFRKCPACGVRYIPADSEKCSKCAGLKL